MSSSKKIDQSPYLYTFLGAQESILSLAGRYCNSICRTGPPEPVFVNNYGAQESIPRNRFRQPM